MKKKFLRKDWRKYSKLGLRRKKKQKYKRAKGIDNKMRLNMKGNLKNISVGFKTKKLSRNLIDGKVRLKKCNNCGRKFTSRVKIKND